MAFIMGVILFALGIVITIALHEAGHMYTARACGMRVRRFFVGFGPTVFSFHKGHTEYGLKAIPFGGFCDIAGMTTLDPVSEEEEPYAMYKKPAWQRVLVLLGGVIVNILLSLIILYGLAVSYGLPNVQEVPEATVEKLVCVNTNEHKDTGEKANSSCQGPAERSGVLPGDKFLSVDGHTVESFYDFQRIIGAIGSAEIAGNANSQGEQRGELPSTHVPAIVERHGQEVPLNLEVKTVGVEDSQGAIHYRGTVGIQVERIEPFQQFSPLSAVGGTIHFSSYMLEQTFQGLRSLPSKIPGILASITGAEREMDSPVSVVGASQAGGQMVERGSWPGFFLLLASLNLFLAVFNLIPLPPLDGGHIAVVLYEKLRDFLRKMRGLKPRGPADYTKLLPITYAAVAVLLVFGVLVMTADIVNPIRL